MSEALSVQLPESLRLVIKDRINLETVLNIATGPEGAEIILDMIQNEIDANAARIAEYYQMQLKNNAVIDNARLEAEQSVRVLDGGASISIYDARRSKGNYHGEVVFTNANYATQRISAESVILHKTDVLDKSVSVGESLQIRYQDGKASVNDWRPAVQKAGLELKQQPEPLVPQVSNKPHYVIRPIQYVVDGIISGPDATAANAIGIYVDMPDGLQEHIADYHLTAIHDVRAEVELLNAGGKSYPIDEALERLSAYEITDADYDKIIDELRRGQDAPIEKIVADPEKSAPDVNAYEVAENYILNLDAEAKIAKPRLSQGNYKGALLNIDNGLVIQQLREHSYIIHDLSDVDPASANTIKAGTQAQYRFIYKDGAGSVELVDSEADAQRTAPKEAPAASIDQPSPVAPKTEAKPVLTGSERRDPEAYEAARAAILILNDEAKISEVRVDKGSYKGSVLNIANGYAIQQIGDASFVIHDVAALPSPAQPIEFGPEHKYRFIYQDGNGRIEKFVLAAEANKTNKASVPKEAAGEVSRPSPAQQAPANTADVTVSPLYKEAKEQSEILLGDGGKLYAARTFNGALSKGEFLFVNSKFAVQKIGKTAAVMHDRSAIDSPINPKSVQGPVAITYQGGKASIEILPHDYWKADTKSKVNQAWAAQSKQAGAQRASSASQTPAPETAAETER